VTSPISGLLGDPPWRDLAVRVPAGAIGQDRGRGVANPGRAVFAAGTHIATPTGERPVEALRPGDPVMALDVGPLEARPVLRVRRVPADVGPPATRVRIRAGALASGLPRRDMLLSPDHALLVEGSTDRTRVLVQAQALVNGASVLREPAPGDLDDWHIELGGGLLFADGVAVESCVVSPPPAPIRPCAPLVLTGPDVAVAHGRVLARAGALGHRISQDGALRLYADGVPLRQIAGPAGLARVRLPAGTRHVRLLSRSFVPTEFGPHSSDSRRLGLAVTAVRLDFAPLPEAAFAAGWYEPEAPFRWTCGDATLALPAVAQAMSLDIATVAAAPGYWEECVRLPLWRRATRAG
jgi:hypothetical protein